ncbi:hypothetical protein HDV00_004899 [Rhizophlyctis rosea]|nr:hypothetical protein HDV00_004899 [Rhizophlyctis rosea]
MGFFFIGSSKRRSSRGRLSKDMISFPVKVDHLAHAGTSAEAETVLRELQNEYLKNLKGLGSIPDTTEPPAVGGGSGVRAFKALMQPFKKDKEKQPHEASKQPTSTTDITPQAPPSLMTVERTVATKIFIENYFSRLNRGATPTGYNVRRAQLETDLASLSLPDAEKRALRKAFLTKEKERTRLAREKITPDDFDTLKILGHGAFGVVKLVRSKASGDLFAMKVLSKREMIRRNQESHVRAERDLMSDASEWSEWICRLVASFQDEDFLYFVMEYMAGGDLLGLLIREDVFEESVARWYAAEMVLCVEEAHKLGMIHRDIKPDNFLFDANGHLKLSDFGLATDFHWAHDSAYYEEQRRTTMTAAGINLPHPPHPHEFQLSTTTTQTISLSPPDSPPTDRLEEPEKLLQKRDRNRKKMAFSVVGTNNYIAPEVLLGVGYTHSCDWWSLGVIVFEMLYGYPPFVSKTRQQTKQKILNWRKTLRFPTQPPYDSISPEAKDFISSLICDASDRLGANESSSLSRGLGSEGGKVEGGAEGILSRLMREGDARAIKAHPWFRGLDWEGLQGARPPFVPELEGEGDTRYFEEVDEEEVMRATWGLKGGVGAGAGGGGGDGVGEEEAEMLEMRKKLAFTGFTYRAPKKKQQDERGGVSSLRLSSVLSSSPGNPNMMSSSFGGAMSTMSSSLPNPPPARSRSPSF